jgi:hypothetical protein
MTRIPRQAKAGAIVTVAALIGSLVSMGQPARAEFFPNVPRESEHPGRGDQRQQDYRGDQRRVESQRRDDHRDDHRDDRRDYRGDDRRYEQRRYDHYNGGYGYGPPPVIYAPPAPPLLQFVFPGY